MPLSEVLNELNFASDCGTCEHLVEEIERKISNSPKLAALKLVNS